MNSTITLTVYSNLGTVKTYEVVDKALEQFDFVVEKFSRFDPKSELTMLNKNNGKPFSASKELIFLVENCIMISKESSYKFDPTVIDILETYGFDAKKDFSILDNQEKLQKELSELMADRPKVDDIKIDKESSTITLFPKQRIDLGGIGKGYAIDLAADYLKSNGINNFIINAGGDLYLGGKKDGTEPFTAGLSMPKNISELFGTVVLENKSLASSGTWANNYKNFNHLIDPKKGKSLEKPTLSYVIHDSATLADGYATMLALTGTEGLKVLVNKKVPGLIVIDDKVIKNKYFPEFN